MVFSQRIIRELPLVNPIPCFFQGTYLLTGLDLFEDSAKFIDTDRDKIQQLCADVDRPGAGVDERICFQVVVVVMAMDYPSGKIQGACAGSWIRQNCVDPLWIIMLVTDPGITSSWFPAMKWIVPLRRARYAAAGSASLPWQRSPR